MLFTILLTSHRVQRKDGSLAGGQNDFSNSIIHVATAAVQICIVSAAAPAPLIESWIVDTLK